MGDFLGIVGFLAILGAVFWLGMVWLPDAFVKWHPRCFPRCKWFEKLPYGSYRCKSCGWTKRIDSKRTRV